MVVAIRQQTTEEQSSEMDTSQKQRKAAELAAAQSASLQEATLPSPSTTTRRGKRKDPRDLGTPPREDNVPPSIVSVDKEASPSSLDKQNSRRPQLPTRQQINNNSSQQNPSNATGLTPQPFATTSLKPSPQGGAITTTLPAPSFGEEDYKVLTSCIENMGSLDSVSDLLNSPDNRHSKDRKSRGDAGEDRDRDREGRRGSSHKYSSDKVEAASRAAAAVLSGDKPKSSTHKDFHRQSTELHSNTTTHHNTTSNTTHNTTTVQLPPTLNLENHGSAESIVVSSPSLGSNKGSGTGNYKDDNSSSLSCSNSPASFMLDVSISLCVLFVCILCPFVTYVRRKAGAVVLEGCAHLMSFCAHLMLKLMSVICVHHMSKPCLTHFLVSSIPSSTGFYTRSKVIILPNTSRGI